MAYTRDNYLKRISNIKDVYLSVKEADKPDTYILRNVFPKHGIFISYRTWMNIKNMKASQFTNQLNLFDTAKAS